jgi:hypothetical protein
MSLCNPPPRWELMKIHLGKQYRLRIYSSNVFRDAGSILIAAKSNALMLATSDRMPVIPLVAQEYAKQTMIHPSIPPG